MGRARKGALRRGFTTGTSAAAGAKAAASLLFGIPAFRDKEESAVFVTLPGKKVLSIVVSRLTLEDGIASATVIKDAGDDPDVTHGAEIVTSVQYLDANARGSGASLVIEGGRGVGRVTRPGLKVATGEPAINPVPLEMIRTAVREAALEAGVVPSVRVTVSVPRGEELARKTMNARLGIIGGISILGTSGIVEPMSLRAYRDSIACAVDVAAESGCDKVLFSTGRSSEKVAVRHFALAPEALVTTGDHMGFAIRCAARKKAIGTIIVAGQFGKFTKLASGWEDTHCSRSSVDKDFLAMVAGEVGLPGKTLERIRSANTAREVYFLLKDMGDRRVFRETTALVAKHCAAIARDDQKVLAALVGYEKDLVCRAASRA